MTISFKDIRPETWFECVYPGTMMDWLKTASGRKHRLFACAACAEIRELFDEDEWKLIQSAEVWANGGMKRTELVAIREQIEARFVRNEWGHLTATSDVALAVATPTKKALKPLIQLLTLAKDRAKTGGWDCPELDLEYHQRMAQDFNQKILHDIFDDLFLDVEIRPEWLQWSGNAVPKMAERIYEDKAFDDMPILADALEDAGCDQSDVLDHCRSDRPHVRGCWVVDRILGKS